MRDRTAAVMLRAATTGGFDYRGADPYDKSWRVRHTLAMREVGRAANQQVLERIHEHWLAYASHSRLESDSWNNAKTQAHEVLQSLQATILPWQEPAKNPTKKDTIEAKYGKLIERYKKMVAEKKAQREKENQNKEAANSGNTDAAEQ